jgi:hypothetical protein
MGQYLTVAMATKITTDKSTALHYKLKPKDIVKRLGDEIAAFEFKDTDDMWAWTLKSSVVEAELVAFLEEIYAHLYEEGESDYEDVLARLRELPSKKWLNMVEGDDKEGYEAFQSNSYGETYILSLPKISDSAEIRLNEESIMLALEGKISMESYGQLFSFFQTAIQHQFQDFKLGSTLRIFITG